MSTTLPECFGDIIGLSRTTCECFDPPENYNLSDSGIYLDEIFDPAIVQALENCTNNDLWDIFDKNRAQAIIQFRADVLVKLLELYRLRRPVFKGQIGRLKYSNQLTLTAGQYAGARFYCADVVSGTMIINKIGTMFAHTGTVDVLVYNNLNELVAGPYTVATTANTHTITTLPVALELPMHRDEIDNIEYYFIYLYNGVQPLNIDIDCNCGQVLRFNTLKPYFNTQTAKQKGWQLWVMVGGFKSSDISDFSDCVNTAMNYPYGLTFPDLELRCDVNEVICKDEIDYISDPLALTYAFAIRWKAAEFVAETILRSPELNREIMIQTEQWQADIEHWRLKYTESINYIVQSIDYKQNDCLMCYDKIPLKRQTILS